MRKIFFLLCSGIISPTLYADCNPDFCEDVYIDRLEPVYNGVVYVATSGVEKNLNCQAVSDVYLTLKADDKGTDKMYSTLLAAQLSGRKINSIQVADNSQGCTIQYISLDRQ